MFGDRDDRNVASNSPQLADEKLQRAVNHGLPIVKGWHRTEQLTR